MPLRLGTRGSALALAQARAVAAALGVESELVVLTTAGDVDRARGDKSRWVGALEAALTAGEIDLAVHSAKDVPSELAPGTAIAATPPRATPWDVLVVAAGGDAAPAEGRPSAGDDGMAATGGRPSSGGGGDTVGGERSVPGDDALRRLRDGARVGTSALRRRAQLLAARPQLAVGELRGNVDTRLGKLAAGEVDALVLAAAGLERLGRGDAGVPLLGQLFVPAPGQGTIAVQARAGGAAADAALALDDAATHACLDAERAAVRALGASCHTPVGVHARHGADGALRVRGFAGLPDGSAWLLDEAESGERLAERMLAAGAAELLRTAEALA